MLWAPWQDGEGIQIRMQVLVRLMNAGKAFDGAAVDHDLVVEGFFQLGASDGDVFELAENIGELHADKFNVVFFNEADNVFF